MQSTLTQMALYILYDREFLKEKKEERKRKKDEAFGVWGFQ